MIRASNVSLYGRKMITPEKEEEIKDLLRNRVPLRKIASICEVSRQTVSDVLHNRRPQRRDPNAPLPTPLTPEERQSLAMKSARVALEKGEKAYFDNPRKTAKFKDNLTLSLRFKWTGVLAEEAGLCPIQDP